MDFAASSLKTIITKQVQIQLNFNSYKEWAWQLQEKAIKPVFTVLLHCDISYLIECMSELIAAGESGNLKCISIVR